MALAFNKALVQEVIDTSGTTISNSQGEAAIW